MSRRNLNLIVCGGRDYENKDAVFSTLDEVHRRRHIALIIEGGATGADRLARTWAIANHVPYLTVEAEWHAYGRAAGPIRNRRMITEGHATGVVAFPGGRGTANMRAQAAEAELPVWEPFKEAVHA